MKPNNILNKLKSAIRLHEHGLLDQAEGLYKEILNEDPLHFDALHLLALVKYQQGHYEDSINLFEKAFTHFFNPNVNGIISFNIKGKDLYQTLKTHQYISI